MITYTVTIQQNSSHAIFLLENVWGSAAHTVKMFGSLTGLNGPFTTPCQPSPASWSDAALLMPSSPATLKVLRSCRSLGRHLCASYKLLLWSETLLLLPPLKQFCSLCKTKRHLLGEPFLSPLNSCLSFLYFPTKFPTKCWLYYSIHHVYFIVTDVCICYHSF